MYAVGTMFSVCRCACEGTLEHTKWLPPLVHCIYQNFIIRVKKFMLNFCSHSQNFLMVDGYNMEHLIYYQVSEPGIAV